MCPIVVIEVFEKLNRLVLRLISRFFLVMAMVSMSVAVAMRMLVLLSRHVMVAYLRETHSILLPLEFRVMPVHRFSESNETRHEAQRYP